MREIGARRLAAGADRLFNAAERPERESAAFCRLPRQTLRTEYPFAFSAWGLLFPAVIAVIALLLRIFIPAWVVPRDVQKVEWEKAHGRSLQPFGKQLIRLRKLLRVFRWVLGYGLLGVALALDVDYIRVTLPKGTLGRDLLFWPLLILTLMALSIYVFLLVGERMTSARLQKLDYLTRPS